MKKVLILMMVLALVFSTVVFANENQTYTIQEVSENGETSIVTKTLNTGEYIEGNFVYVYEKMVAYKNVSNYYVKTVKVPKIVTKYRNVNYNYFKNGQHINYNLNIPYETTIYEYKTVKEYRTVMVPYYSYQLIKKELVEAPKN